MSQNKLVIVTGANGQLGWEMQQAAKNAGQFEFRFFGSKDLDITDFEAVGLLIDKVKPQYIVNCAAYTAVDKAEDEENLAFRINGDAVGNLAKCASNVNATLLHISTDYVFNGNAQTPYTPIEKCEPIGVYGKSKYEGEKQIHEMANSAIIIRTAWVYSSHGNNFVKTMLRLGKDKNELGIVSDQIGGPTYAKDLALNLVELIRNGVKPSGVEVHHFTNDGVCSWAQFALEIFKLGKIECKVNFIKTEDYPTKAQRPKYSVLSNDSLLQKYPFLTNRNWKMALEECVGKLS
ncbi:MAG: dTDP-4-dehydrorhamnose reductase [Bacteroidia bacterium]